MNQQIVARFLAFALDNNRGSDGSAYQAEHFYAVLHDERQG
jgi:hypothetical protein